MSYVNYNKITETQVKAKQIQNGVKPKTTALFEQNVPRIKEPMVLMDEPAIEPPKPKTTGIVVDCAKLNVRIHPNSRAAVVCVISKSSEVTIDEAESTEDFYKICTAAGAEGFCMKEFVELK